MHSLILIRHGQSEHHLGDLTGGWTDCPLTPLGQQQVTLLAERLKRELSAFQENGITLPLISSDLLRARQTAEIISETLALPLTLEPALREYNNGAAAGLTRDAAESIRTPRNGAFQNWRPYPGSETWHEFFARVAAWLEHFTASQTGPAILVSHGGTIINTFIWWLGLGDYLATGNWISFGVQPASFNLVRSNEWGERVLERVNDTAHLYAAGLTYPLKF